MNNRERLQKLIKQRGFDRELNRFDEVHLSQGSLNTLYSNLGINLRHIEIKYVSSFLNDNEKRLHLQALGFINDNGKIDFPEYKQNRYQYRSDEFSKDHGIITLGCSNTFGSYQKVETTWAFKLAKHLDKKLYNLAIPGAGVETNYLSLKYHAKEFRKGTEVFWLIPGISRMDSYLPHRIIRANPGMIDAIERNLSDHHFKVLKDYYFEYYTHSANLIKQFSVYVDAVKTICKENNFKLYYFVDPILYANGQQYINKLNEKKINGYLDRGCDLKHLGINYQEDIYMKFLEKLSGNSWNSEEKYLY